MTKFMKRVFILELLPILRRYRNYLSENSRICYGRNAEKYSFVVFRQYYADSSMYSAVSVNGKDFAIARQGIEVEGNKTDNNSALSF